MAAKRKKKRKLHELDPAAGVAEIMADERIVWFPIKHYSPACAYHVDKLIRALRPRAVLVEGPDSATDLIPHIVDDDSWPPLAILSSYTDKKNEFGQNGKMSPSDAVPARFRAWYPIAPFAPEYAALRAGAAVGAELRFIDAPLRATIPFHHVRTRRATEVVSDRHLAENTYFEALKKRQRRRSFDEFWQANFEAGGLGLGTEAFIRMVLTFAWCTRHVVPEKTEAFELDGTTLREAHMRWHVDTCLKELDSRAKADAEANAATHGEAGIEGASLAPREDTPVHDEDSEESAVLATDFVRPVEPTHDQETERDLPRSDKIVVVTGAFHSVVLPWVKKKRAKAKPNKNSEVIVTAHSYKALASLYQMSRLPNHASLAWEEMQRGDETPFDTAAMQLLIEIMRVARDDRNVGVSTADVVGAYKVAKNLATLRQNREITLDDLLDAVQMAYVKGDKRISGVDIEAATREVLVGERVGRVTPAAGQVPIMRDFYLQTKTHKIDTTGKSVDVKCDIHKQEKHRRKSAFLHQCDYLDVPLFGRLKSSSRWRRRRHFSGPNPVAGEDMHLIQETWAVRWDERVDASLLELSERGATIAEAARHRLEEDLRGAVGHAADSTKLLLRTAQMMLLDVFDDVLDRVETAIQADSSFDNLAAALQDFVILHSYRDAMATRGHARLLDTIVGLFTRACLAMPAIANADVESSPATLDHLQSVVRIALTFEPVELDRTLLVERLRLMVEDADGQAAIRGAGFGVLFSLGATREKVVARELSGYLMGSPERVLQAGAFLDGLFRTAKSIFMGTPRLMRAINGVLARLDWRTFKVLLPDLRRAFTQFIPSEISDISVRVSEEIGIDEEPQKDLPIDAGLAAAGAGADARVSALIDGWVESPGHWAAPSTEV